MNKSDIYYKALLARDYRFDGKFYVGVKTTQIYCRPICPARPKKENVQFYESSIAAENAGYRPCLRCRPESAPQSPVWHGKSSTVQRALRFIASNALLDSNEEEFAAHFGLSARHLRRLFEEEIGQTPKQISDSNRLGFARKLMIETDLPVTVVALTSGFLSLRRFNDAFKKRFHRSPTDLRKNQEVRTGNLGVELSLSYRPPFHWENILDHYRSHQIIGVDRVLESIYERVFRIDGSLGCLRLKNIPEQSKLSLHVVTDDPKILFQVAQKVRMMFDLDSDPLLILNAFQSEPLLESLWNKYPGLRVPQGWEPFESAICTILGQLVSVQQARNLIGQLVKAHGERVIHPIEQTEAYIFPTPEILAEASLDEVKTTKIRKQTIREFSRRVVKKEIALNHHQDLLQMRERLLSVPGIGPWSAEYMGVRAFGHVDAFPETDLILKRALEQNPDLNLDQIRPWRSYAAVYLWKEYAIRLSKGRAAKSKIESRKK